MQSDPASLYGQEYVRNFEANQPIERLRRLLPLMDLGAQSIVGDFACGNGMMMDLVAPLVKKYIGIDFSPSFIEAANRRMARLGGGGNASFCCAGIEDFCAEHPEYFDVCLAMDLSEHVRDEEWIAILAGIRSSMKNGGKLYSHTPNADFFLEIMKEKNVLFSQFKEHVAVRTAGRNADMFYRAGFSRVDVVFLPHYNALKILHPLSFIPKVGKYFKARLFISAVK